MGIPETPQLPSWQRITTAIAAENELAQDSRKRILVPLPFCGTHDAASVVVQGAMPVRPPTVRVRQSQFSIDPSKAIQALQGKPPKAVEGGFKLRSKRQTPCKLRCRI